LGAPAKPAPKCADHALRVGLVIFGISILSRLKSLAKHIQKLFGGASYISSSIETESGLMVFDIFGITWKNTITTARILEGNEGLLTTAYSFTDVSSTAMRTGTGSSNIILSMEFYSYYGDDLKVGHGSTTTLFDTVTFGQEMEAWGYNTYSVGIVRNISDGTTEENSISVKINLAFGLVLVAAAAASAFGVPIPQTA
jgi:hypothetical protein